MSVQKLPVKVQVRLNLGGPGMKNENSIYADLGWVQDAVLLIDLHPPTKPSSKESKESTQ